MIIIGACSGTYKLQYSISMSEMEGLPVFFNSNTFSALFTLRKNGLIFCIFGLKMRGFSADKNM
jgi:hypothetical protein